MNDTNGHLPNVVPEGPPVGTDSPRSPSVDDVIMQSLGERWETTRELLQFPTELSHAIPRAVLTQRQSVDMLRSSMLHDLWNTSTWDSAQLGWEKMALSVPVDGRGRKEAVDIATSAVQRATSEQRPREGPKPR